MNMGSVWEDADILQNYCGSLADKALASGREG